MPKTIRSLAARPCLLLCARGLLQLGELHLGTLQVCVTDGGLTGVPLMQIMLIVGKMRDANNGCSLVRITGSRAMARGVNGFG
jgi:hypothetical protein